MNVDELDRILDEALASYALAEPRAGLSARILARVVDRTPPSWNWLHFAVGALAMAGLIVALVVPPPRETTPAPVYPRIVEQVPSAPVVPPSLRPQQFRRLAHRANLTREQRALLTFAQQAPEVARQLAQPDKPLEIEPIDIRPLEIADLKIGEME